MAYNSKYTGEQIEALLDKAGKIEGSGGEYDISSIYSKILIGKDIEITKEEYDGVANACAGGKTLYYYGTQGEKVRTLQYTVYSDENGSEIYIRDTLLFTLRGLAAFCLVISSSNSRYTVLYEEETVNIPDMSKYATYSYLDNFALKSSLDNYAKTSEVESMIAAVPSPHRTVVVENSETIGFGTSNYANIPSIELAADKFYIIGRSSGLEITLPNGSDTDGKEYVCQFYVGSNYGSYTLTLPDTVAWLNGEAPTFESTTCYMLSIVNHCAVIGVFKQAS